MSFASVSHRHNRLQQMTEQSVDSILSTARASLEECDETPSVADEEFQTVDDELTRPSEYLRSRWPLCFGGKGGANDEQVLTAFRSYLC